MQKTGSVSQWCGHQKHILPGEIEAGTVGTLAGKDVVVGQHYAFWHSLGTGGKQHCRQFIGVNINRLG